jgi:hypothetical protein
MTGSAFKAMDVVWGVASQREDFLLKKGREFEGGRVNYRAASEAGGFIAESLLGVLTRNFLVKPGSLLSPC